MEPFERIAMRHWIIALVLAVQCPAWAQPDEALQAALRAPHRTPAFVARDVWRHPYETLQFFGLRRDAHVVELSPGGGWYTEILAPYLRERGQLTLAGDDPASADPALRNSALRLQAKLAAMPALYDKVKVAVLAPPERLQYAAPGSADLVLTFRNVHNWSDKGDDVLLGVFQSAFTSLRRGGVLGVVEHRLPASRVEDAGSKGYVPVQYVQRMAERVGFRLEASSEINANPLDTADHTGGVWALPPSYVNKDVDRARYAAIGESDRMTLRFVKP